MIYHFEGHSLDTARRELRRGEQLIALEPQVFDVLQYLLRHRGRVVSKDELVAGVWNNRVVSDSTLSSRISALRHALGDSGASQALIRTMARKGLRFVAPVREAAALTEPPGADAPLAQLSPASPTPLAAGAERRQVTILACRMADAMALSARLDPEALRDVLADYRSTAAAIADEHGGVLAHDTGDGLAIHFGFPAAREDDAERAVRAGLALAGLRHEGTERAAARRVERRHRDRPRRDRRRRAATTRPRPAPSSARRRCARCTCSSAPSPARCSSARRRDASSAACSTASRFPQAAAPRRRTGPRSC